MTLSTSASGDARLSGDGHSGDSAWAHVVSLLAHSSDDRKLAGLLLVPRTVQAGSPRQLKQVWNATGAKFFLRLLRTRQAGMDDELAYAKLSLLILSHVGGALDDEDVTESIDTKENTKNPEKTIFGAICEELCKLCDFDNSDQGSLSPISAACILRMVHLSSMVSCLQSCQGFVQVCEGILKYVESLADSGGLEEQAVTDVEAVQNSLQVVLIALSSDHRSVSAKTQLRILNALGRSFLACALNANLHLAMLQCLPTVLPKFTHSVSGSDPAADMFRNAVLHALKSKLSPEVRVQALSIVDSCCHLFGCKWLVPLGRDDSLVKLLGDKQFAFLQLVVSLATLEARMILEEINAPEDSFAAFTVSTCLSVIEYSFAAFQSAVSVSYDEDSMRFIRSSLQDSVTACIEWLQEHGNNAETLASISCCCTRLLCSLLNDEVAVGTSNMFKLSSMAARLIEFASLDEGPGLPICLPGILNLLSESDEMSIGEDKIGAAGNAVQKAAFSCSSVDSLQRLIMEYESLQSSAVRPSDSIALSSVLDCAGVMTIAVQSSPEEFDRPLLARALLRIALPSSPCSSSSQHEIWTLRSVCFMLSVQILRCSNASLVHQTSTMLPDIATEFMAVFGSLTPDVWPAEFISSDSLAAALTVISTLPAKLRSAVLIDSSMSMISEMCSKWDSVGLVEIVTAFQKLIALISTLKPADIVKKKSQESQNETSAATDGRDAVSQVVSSMQQSSLEDLD